MHEPRAIRRANAPRGEACGLGPSSSESKPKVAVFATNFGAPSQTFVYEQVRFHARYAPEVFTWTRTNAECFPFEPVHEANALYGVTAFSPEFLARFEEAGFSLVHAHFGPGAVYAVPYALAFGLPLVVTFHGYDVPLLASRQRFRPVWWPYALFGRTVLRRMTLGLCVSEDLRDQLVALGAPAAKLRVFRLGVDLSEFRATAKPKDRFQVVMIGRFVEKKGFAYGLRAFERFLRSGRRGKLVILGEGELEADLRELAASLRIEGDVEWRGWVTPTEVAAVLAESHVLLAPSVLTASGDREGCPMVVQEAAACGVVVVGSRHGGIAEAVVDGETGYLVPERDDASLAARLATLHDVPALRERMASAGSSKARRERDLVERIGALETHYDEARARFAARRCT